MIEHNKTYGFTIAVKELRETVPNIFRYASAYKRLNNLTSQGLWEMFVEPQPDKEPEPPANPNHLPEEVLRSDPGRNRPPEIDPEAMEGEKYNMCHFWSNFEIARLDFFRSKAYEDFFQMMDRSGGFWMERVRSVFVETKNIPTPFLSVHTHDACANDRAQPNSGATRRSTRSPRARSWRPATSTTSATLATATRRSSTAPPTPRSCASCRASPTSR